MNYRTALVGKLLIVAFHAIRVGSDWNAAKEWETSPLFTLPAGLEAAFEVHCAAVSNSSIGLHGVEVQVAQHTIALRSSGKMTVSANGGMGRRLYHGATCLGERHSTRNRHGKTLYQDVIPANPAK